jgi:hypothetical protein
VTRPFRRSAKLIIIGPILQDLRRPVNDLPAALWRTSSTYRHNSHTKPDTAKQSRLSARVVDIRFVSAKFRPMKRRA